MSPVQSSSGFESKAMQIGEHVGSANNNKVAHKRNKAKVQVNNFLDDDLEADIGERSHTEGHEVLSLAE